MPRPLTPEEQVMAARAQDEANRSRVMAESARTTSRAAQEYTSGGLNWGPNGLQMQEDIADHFRLPPVTGQGMTRALDNANRQAVSGASAGGAGHAPRLATPSGPSGAAGALQSAWNWLTD